jgi:hypothetical protein
MFSSYTTTVVLLYYPVEVRQRRNLFLLCFTCFTHAARAGKTLSPLDWFNIARFAIFSTCLGPSFTRSRARLPTHSCGAASFPGGTKRIGLPFLGFFFLAYVLQKPLSVFHGTGSCAGITPMIWSLNLRNRAPLKWICCEVSDHVLCGAPYH